MLKQGRVLRYQSGFYTVSSDDGVITCNARKKIKRASRESGIQTDLIALGDLVEFTLFPDQTGVIERVLPRRNELVRKLAGMKSESRPDRANYGPSGDYRQVLIANLDQMLLVFAAADPEPRPRMLDRFLVICEKQQIHPIILFNKTDLGSEAFLDHLFAIYQKIGYDVLFTSAAQNIGIDAVKERLTGKVTGLIGPSGVGKSSLINRIDPSLNLKVNQISDYNKKGKHTTVVREMFPLECGGYIADFPGVKTLALWDIEPEELDGYFPEIRPLVADCLYSDCTHHPDEQGCAVHAAVEAGTVTPERYESYLRIRFGDPDEPLSASALGNPDNTE